MKIIVPAFALAIATPAAAQPAGQPDAGHGQHQAQPAQPAQHGAHGRQHGMHAPGQAHHQGGQQGHGGGCPCCQRMMQHQGAQKARPVD